MKPTGTEEENEIYFRGEFRTYQREVLSAAEEYARDGRVHVVAPPGSGKTILGLELIRRMGMPALVLSPTVVIRRQWKERFAEKFVSDPALAEKIFSFDLKAPSAITSVTYQALHAALSRSRLPDEEAEGEGEANDGAASENPQDFSDFDWAEAFRAAGIRTVCLDEAHHLKSEWQKALEAFISAISADGVKVIALTATPPYDSPQGEWQRYISLCGEIDAEISVPRLVKENALCPHQDFVYFSYPTKEETARLNAYREKAARVAAELVRSDLFHSALSVIETAFGGSATEADDSVFLLEHGDDVAALLCVLERSGARLPKKLLKRFWPVGRRPPFRMETIERALNFIISAPETFGPLSAELKQRLAAAGVTERGKVCLLINDRLKRSLASSSGKLRAIEAIVGAEEKSLGSGLRMLILTDYIRGDMKGIIGGGEEISAMGTVPVFEAVRRSGAAKGKIGLLSGELVVLPDEAVSAAVGLSESEGFICTSKKIGETGYSEVSFSGSNKNKVSVVSELFRRGQVCVLVGTKSLLGEGWDAPWINSLVLASFVGSFVLSNQMRGRAIRTDPDNPDKTANIWHLVTAERPFNFTDKAIRELFPESDGVRRAVLGADYETVERRFDCFLAPAYEGNVIESGIERIGAIKPPFDEKRIKEIDRKMLALAADREGVRTSWKNALDADMGASVSQTEEIPAEVLPKGFIWRNGIYASLLAACMALLTYGSVSILPSVGNLFWPTLLIAALYALFARTLWRCILRLLRFCSPERTVKTLCGCLLETLKRTGDVRSPSARLSIKSDPTGIFVYCALKGGTLREQAVFAGAAAELLSAIDNPRYVAVRRLKIFGLRVRDYSQSYACPAVVGGKKETAELFAKLLKGAVGSFEAIYTRSEEGRRALLKCRRRSYINRNEKLLKSKKFRGNG